MTAFIQIRRSSLVAAVGLVAAACGSPGPVSSSPAAPSPVRVFAAASLTAAFQSMGSAAGHVNPPLLTEYNFAGSSTLVAQIQQGAPADVFASADQPNMQKLVDGGLGSGSPRVFATNRLQILVAARNPEGITMLAVPVRPGLGAGLLAPRRACEPD